MLLSPTGTDPDRPNPQTFCFTSTLCPNAERTSHVSEVSSETVSSGSKDLFSFIFSFLDYVAPVLQVFSFGRAF